MTSAERSDNAFMGWMRGNLTRAATRFGLTITGDATFGWRLRSITAPARDPQGRPRWLRVTTEQSRWLDAAREMWDGNLDANAITGVPKPRVLDLAEWEAPDQHRHVHAETMTALPGQPSSPTSILRRPLTLPDTWWHHLRQSLDHLRTVPTTRRDGITIATRRVREVLDVDLTIQRVETAHGDLHWANLLTPQLGILDWELWGLAPAGTDAATLYCTSLLEPTMATRVWHHFNDILDTPDGQCALLTVAARLLRRTTLGDHPDLAAPLNTLTTQLLAQRGSPKPSTGRWTAR